MHEGLSVATGDKTAGLSSVGRISFLQDTDDRENPSPPLGNGKNLPKIMILSSFCTVHISGP
jgi:hypothetical protein